MRVYFMLAYRVWANPSPVMVDTLAILRKRGIEVKTGIAAQMLMEPGKFPLDYDLYVLKSRSSFWLSMAGIVHRRGGLILNPYPACVAVRDKIVVTGCLLENDLPIPASWITGDMHHIKTLAHRMPLILKPCFGEQGQGITIIRKPEDLDQLPKVTQLWLIQEYIHHDKEDIKVYVIGQHLFAVRKRFGEGSFMQPGTPCKIGYEIQELVLRVGKALDLSLYGVDLIEGPNGPVVVDVNVFPSYRQVPDAPAKLADHIAGYTRRN